jgi:hypothetical protein
VRARSGQADRATHLSGALDVRGRPGWFHDEIYSLVSAFRTVFCIYELNGLISPMEITSDFICLHLHDPAEKCKGRYSI